MKMTVAEVLVPAVIKLYSRMKPRGGQSTTYLLQLSTDLVKDYESEVNLFIITRNIHVGM